ncbi:MAG: HAMP domain-containing histidine kinase [Actinobacteria bacterium]|nr:HAMP domain-containing histidine kinase [Actinomycetota bacterium]
MPNWLGSIRFRLTVIYSSVLFLLAALMVFGIYVALDRSLSNEAVVQRYITLGELPDGRKVVVDDRVTIDLAKAIEQDANQRATDLLRQYSFGALLALFVTSLGVGWVVAGRVLKPIGRITSVAREIQATDLSRRIEMEGPEDELKELADTFDDMLGRIDGAFEQQKQFIHEASHELRNPLAVIRTNLDVTLADPAASPDELRQTMQVVQRSSERMTRLVDDLLVYARKGTDPTMHEQSLLDVSVLVAESAEEFRAPADARGIRLQHRLPDDQLWVMGDRDALRRALANLLANAVRLAPPNSTITVSNGREGPWVWMAVEDEGPGIAVEDQGRVFQRFFRGDAVAGRTEGRSGLGLTIVRQIAEAHGGDVRLVSELGRGSAFAIWIPASPGLPQATPGSRRGQQTPLVPAPESRPVAAPPTREP